MENFFPPSFVILRKELKCGRTEKMEEEPFQPVHASIFFKTFFLGSKFSCFQVIISQQQKGECVRACVSDCEQVRVLELGRMH